MDEPKLKHLIDLLEEQKRNAPEPQEFTAIPKYKMVRDGMLTVPAKPTNVPKIAATMVREHIQREQIHYGHGLEIMCVILLSRDNFPITSRTIGVGTEDMVIVDPKRLFSFVLSEQFNAYGFILGHNHPSGHPEPSNADRATMEEFKILGLKLTVPLCDFIIIADGNDDYYSENNESYFLKTI